MSQCSTGSDVRSVQDNVKQYYGKDLQRSDDCQTGINCLRPDLSLPQHVREAFADVHEEVTLKYFGCGPVIPEALENCNVLDLGSGSGRDCFALSKLIGPSGHVVGVDMTEEQLETARKYMDYHMTKFGYSTRNVDFVFGYIEKLGDAGIQDNSFDLIVSNCVICLCPDKAAVLREAHRVLKEGGELYFSDMYTDSVVSEKVRNDPVLWGEGMGGALLWHDLYQLARDVGFSQPRLFTATLADTSKFSDVLGGANFVSVTYRLFKLPEKLRPTSRVTYTGGILGCDETFKFDHAVTFEKGEKVVVDSELATILSCSRFSKYFSVAAAETLAPQTPDPKVDPVQFAASKTGSAGKLCGSCK